MACVSSNQIHLSRNTVRPSRLRDELVRRDYAATTIRSYIQIVDAFRHHTGARLDRITPAQLRRYHLFLLEERRLAIGTVVTQICALRFFCRHVLNRRDVREAGVFVNVVAHVSGVVCVDPYCESTARTAFDFIRLTR
ncbi:MAG: phage integrase N-terminal SAM-like domain-containing protein [Vicinamibacterales bacterium]